MVRIYRRGDICRAVSPGALPYIPCGCRSSLFSIFPLSFDPPNKTLLGLIPPTTAEDTHTTTTVSVRVLATW